MHAKFVATPLVNMRSYDMMKQADEKAALGGPSSDETSIIFGRKLSSKFTIGSSYPT